MGYSYFKACRKTNENKIALYFDAITFSDLYRKNTELTNWCKENVSGGFYVSIDSTSFPWWAKNGKEDMKNALKYCMFDANIIVYFIDPNSALLFKLAFG